MHIIVKKYNKLIQEFTSKKQTQIMNTQNEHDQYQSIHQIDRPLQQQNGYNQQELPVLLSKKQQTQLLYGIKIEHQHNQNLLDLTCQETNPRTSRNMNYRQFVQDRIIDISGPLTIQQGYIVSYKLYKIKSKKKDADSWDTVVQRRFSDFQYLYMQLIDNYGGYLIPKLPEKSIWASLDMETPDYIRNRKQRLKKFIQKILQHNRLRYTQQVITFLFDIDNNFSQKKGEYSSHNKLQDTVIKYTTNALQSGYTLLNKYIPLSTSTQKQMAIRPIIITTKQDQQIAHYQVLVNGMTAIIKEIKIIVINTYEEANIIEKFGAICDQLLTEDQDKEMGSYRKSKVFKVKQLKNEKVFDRYSRQITISQELAHQNNQYQQLLQNYQNLFDFIQACKQAITRRNLLSQQLKSLRQQQATISQKYKQNPRSINVDILRSKIQQITKKHQQFTQQLLGQLDTQIMMSRSMVNQFVRELQQARCQLYGEVGGGSGGV